MTTLILWMIGMAGCWNDAGPDPAEPPVVPEPNPQPEPDPAPVPEPPLPPD